MMDGIQGIWLLRKLGHITPGILIERRSAGRYCRVLFCHQETVGHLQQVCMLLITGILEMNQTMGYLELPEQKRFPLDGIVVQQPGVVAFTDSRIRDIREIKFDLIAYALAGILIDLPATTEQDMPHNFIQRRHWGSSSSIKFEHARGRKRTQIETRDDQHKHS